ncbi:SDR family oxidoreductase [Colwellia sp. MB02u-18]|uniref:SDR family oxidoreductase n=1 Tax=unclassified Colwellia TaxID=196834 RepID=UPI0015F63D0A|nr:MULTISPECIES: SDR family oxidoreductase [unclassified Colwellia]MBA6223929.1 SDR family oxidoreductase [Colwellia sp. MB3u-45]MBA6267364.1 SDR family oxidoreductase [Colwellia sp. MB3u-43]MBA6320110.1 SDR family oxidoreductase [Colwellia sp. MB02u-19]MBA6324820.1 SDR family oxidoreductase [Colwellia sp. MB02u-18]MBA6330501.1 SDR family oxidoreductase [Colwellia sp. MB02u-12]
MKNNIVITGANRGIGLAMCMHFKTQGDRVFGLCRKTSVELTALDVNIIEDIDVTSDLGIANMVSGLKHIDIDVLVCNAGILRDESLANLNLNTIREQFEVNALAPLRVVASLQKQLKQGAKVALITSRMGSIADNDSGGRYGYRMSKAALNAAAMSLSHDLASNKVAVGIYHPGYVQTEMVNYGGDISASDAAKKLVELINQLTLAQSGIFKHSNGSVLPW